MALAKHDFIDDNPYIAYSGKSDLTALGGKVFTATYDGDTITTDESFDEAFEMVSKRMSVSVDMYDETGSANFIYLAAVYGDAGGQNAIIFVSPMGNAFKWTASGMVFE